MKNLTLLCILAFAFHFLNANNIQVSNISLTNLNTGSGFVNVQFDIRWENSWRMSAGPANWDAAWIFVKYRKNSGTWEHASLNYVDGTAANDGHSQPTGSVLTTPSDGRGCFVYRDANGDGDVTYSGVELRWNYSSDGVLASDILDVQVHAIEMVYVPQAAFFAGDGQSLSSFYEYPAAATPFEITSENAISVGTNAGDLYYNSNFFSNHGDQLGPIPAGFPKGFEGFYCMKYEASHQQWISFFNSLSASQKLNHDLTDVNHKNSNAVVQRNTLLWSGSGDATTSTPDRAISYIHSMDAMAYLDWAGLRPMTEFEFEKASRGTNPSVPGEFAWGDDNIDFGVFLNQNDGLPDEQIIDLTSGNGNAIWSAAILDAGPYRCGIFAGSGLTPTRIETGASYYGIMEMTGNVEEVTITPGRPEGRSFTGVHGDGEVDTNGYADEVGWPVQSGWAGIGYRGGSYNSTTPQFFGISNRFLAAPALHLQSVLNSGFYGFRGVRTAP